MSTNTNIHIIGRVWTILSLMVICSVPVVICAYLGVMPNANYVLAGILQVGIIYIPIGIIETLTYVPILGPRASYLAFVTGNLTNLKIPCVMNALEMSGYEQGSEQADILSALSVASSTLVTTCILIVGVLALAPLTPILSSPTLTPAFTNVVPALFGALGYMFISQNPKISVLPIAFILVLFLTLPPTVASGISGGLIPISVLVTIVGARVLYKKNWV